jgi:DNA-binding CsgD family transcriptional regulator
VGRLRGQVAADQGRASDAARLLLTAARRFEPLDADLARETHLEALVAAMAAGNLGLPGGVRKAAEAALAAPPGPEPPRAVDLVLDALALRGAQGHATAAAALSRALERLVTDSGDDEASRSLWMIGGRVSAMIALELWDFESWQVLATRQVQVARDMGAFVQLQFAISILGLLHLVAGELGEMERLVEEDRVIAEATGNPPFAHTAMMLAAWQGRPQEASELIQATVELATAQRMSLLADLTAWASAVLDNGLGRYEAARAAAWQAFEGDHLGQGALVVAELAEAAARTRDATAVRAVLDWLSERTRATRTEWALGIEARVRALLSDGQVADGHYRESIQRLSRTRIGAQLARSHLLYGEWLRRQGRRVDAREQLRTAYRTLDAMGMAAFAERARHELLATGETGRKRAALSARTRGAGFSEALTAQEAQVARLALDGLSNPEIGARLFISPRTAKYHLSNVFTRLGITSRSQLDRVLAVDADTVGPR